MRAGREFEINVAGRNPVTLVVRWAMGYSIHIEVPDDEIEEEEWTAAVDALPDVRLAGSREDSVSNPATGERIGIPIRDFDAELYFPEDEQWHTVFFWSEGRASFRAPNDWLDPGCHIRSVARQLAQLVGGQLVGDEDERYD